MYYLNETGERVYTFSKVSYFFSNAWLLFTQDDFFEVGSFMRFDVLQVKFFFRFRLIQTESPHFLLTLLGFHLKTNIQGKGYWLRRDLDFYQHNSHRWSIRQCIMLKVLKTEKMFYHIKDNKINWRS